MKFEIKWCADVNTVGPVLQSMFWHSLKPGVFLCERSRVLFTVTVVILQSADRQKSPSAAVDTWESNTRLTSYFNQTVRDFLRCEKPKSHAWELLTLAPMQNDFFFLPQNRPTVRAREDGRGGWAVAETIFVLTDILDRALSGGFHSYINTQALWTWPQNCSVHHQ